MKKTRKGTKTFMEENEITLEHSLNPFLCLPHALCVPILASPLLVSILLPAKGASAFRMLFARHENPKTNYEISLAEIRTQVTGFKAQCAWPLHYEAAFHKKEVGGKEFKTNHAGKKQKKSGFKTLFETNFFRTRTSDEKMGE